MLLKRNLNQASFNTLPELHIHSANRTGTPNGNGRDERTTFLNTTDQSSTKKLFISSSSNSSRSSSPPKLPSLSISSLTVPERIEAQRQRSDSTSSLLNYKGKTSSSIPRSNSTLCLSGSTTVPQFEELNLPKDGDNNDGGISLRYHLVKEVDRLLHSSATGVDKGSGRIQPEKCKLLLVGSEANSYSNVLKKTNTFGVTVASTKNALEMISSNSSEYGVVLVFHPISDGNTFDFLPKLKQHHLPAIVFTNGRPSSVDRQKCLDLGAFECFSVLSPLEAIIGHIKGLYENTWLRRQLRQLVVKEKEDILLDYNPDMHLYNKERYLTLEEHVKILESYKTEAESCILMMEEENLKMKAEVLTLKEKLEKTTGQNIAGKWRLAALKDKQKKQALKNVYNLRLKLEDLKEEGGSPRLDRAELSKELSPIQSITRTVSKLTKVSELLDVADLKNVLNGVMLTLGSSSDLYSPSRQVLEQLDMDEMSKQYIVSGFTGYGGVNSESLDDSGSKKKIPKDSMPAESMIDRSKEGYLRNLAYVVWSLSQEDMENLVAMMFEQLGLIDEFDIPIETLFNWIRCVAKHYRNNPFHNFYHAFDVTHMCFTYLSTSFRQYLTKTDMLSMLLAALCHDLGHPGTNNNFQIMAESDLALLYNDQSVLENLHCSKAFSIMKEEGCDILQHVPKNVYRDIRKSMISAIMATDMAVHFELTSRFTTHVEARNNDTNTPLFTTDIKERQLLLNVLLHSADISNMVRQPPIAKQWSDLVFEEFLDQGDKEKVLGLPVSPFSDRDDTDQSKMSLNFIDYVVAPLFNALTKGTSELQLLTDNLAQNREFWQKENDRREMLKKQQKEEKEKDES